MKSTEELVADRNRKANREFVKSLFMGLALLLTIAFFVEWVII